MSRYLHVLPPRYALAILIVLFPACASSDSAQQTGEIEIDADRYEIACEAALVRLESLIEQQSAAPSTGPASLIEARELYQLGQELYLEREYAVALEMLQQGIRLLEDRSG